MKRGLLVGALALAAAGVFGQTPPLTLDQAVTAALTSGLDRVVLASNAEATQAAYQKTALSAGPTVKLTGGVSGASAPAATTQTAEAGATVALGPSSLTVKGSQTTDSTQGLSVALTQNLWDGYLGGQTGGMARQAELQLQAAQLAAAADQRALVQSVKTAYYTVLSAQENQAALAATTAQTLQSLTLIQARFDAKQASVLDVQTAKINHQTAELDQQEGLNTLKKARLSLAHLMGRATTDFVVAEAEEPAPTPGSVDEAIVYALGHRYERTTTDLAVQAARVGLDLAQAAGQPTVDLTAGANQSATKASSQTALTLGVNVSWSAWDSGTSNQNVVRQRALVQVAEASQQGQLLTIRREVEAAWDDWKLKSARAELAALTVDKDQAALAVARAQHEAGTLTNTLLLEAETNAMDAVTARATAIIQLRLAVLTLKTALGSEE